MSDITKLTISEANAMLRLKEVSATEITKAHIEKAQSLNALNAFITLTPDIAMEQARKSDEKIRNGQAGIIEGIPIGVKDLFCTKGVQTTAGSAMLKGYIPQYESTVTRNLFTQGGIMIGKTNMDEFAMGSANITSHYGNVISPWKRKNDNKDLVPGGSSGGSSAAVSAHMCMGALGSDTGGSIRQPAAFTGIVGVKPTYGRCSRRGMVAFASSLDQAGVFARTVADSALLLQSIAGHDPHDSTSYTGETPDFSAKLTAGVKGLKIGIPKEYMLDNIPAQLKAFWEKGSAWLKERGAEIIEISLPHTSYALPVYYIIAPAEASSNLARYDGVRYGMRVLPPHASLEEMYEATRANFGTEVKRRIIIGTYVLSSGFFDAYYLQAQKIRRLIANDFTEAFSKVDAILTPSAPSTAFAIGENLDDPMAMYLMDVFTVPASLAGIPGISVPAGLAEDGLPLGLQILTKHYDESTLFQIAASIEQAANFKITI
jgi:aspartyl-tRNA(Asn)/glutamyl-tRNA(Gln) amidotransferase subunit A